MARILKYIFLENVDMDAGWKKGGKEFHNRIWHAFEHFI